MGDVIQIEFQPDGGGDDIDTGSALGWINDRVNAVPPRDDCPSGTVADEPPRPADDDLQLISDFHFIAARVASGHRAIDRRSDPGCQHWVGAHAVGVCAGCRSRCLPVSAPRCSCGGMSATKAGPGTGPVGLWIWIALTVVAGVVAPAGWRNSRPGSAGGSVLAIPPCMLSAALAVNHWVGYADDNRRLGPSHRCPLGGQIDANAFARCGTSGERPINGTVMAVRSPTTRPDSRTATNCVPAPRGTRQSHHPRCRL